MIFLNPFDFGDHHLFQVTDQHVDFFYAERIPHEFHVPLQNGFSLKFEKRFGDKGGSRIGPGSLSGSSDHPYFDFFHWRYAIFTGLGCQKRFREGSCGIRSVEVLRSLVTDQGRTNSQKIVFDLSFLVFRQMDFVSFGSLNDEIRLGYEFHRRLVERLPVFLFFPKDVQRFLNLDQFLSYRFDFQIASRHIDFHSIGFGRSGSVFEDVLRFFFRFDREIDFLYRTIFPLRAAIVFFGAKQIGYLRAVYDCYTRKDFRLRFEFRFSTARDRNGVKLLNTIT